MLRLFLFAALLGAVAGPDALQGQDKWLRVTSPHFELYTSEGRSTAVYTIRHFEQVRGFFVNAFKLKPDESRRVRLVAFRSDKEFRRFLKFQWGAASYLRGRDGDYIVMKRTGEQFSKTAVHEYVHLLANHARLKLPPWLNEGIANFYATLRPVGGAVRVGEFDPGLTQMLMSSKWLPLSDLLETTQKAAYQGSENKVGTFYAQSWALTHMLIMDDDYHAKFPDFFRAIQTAPPADVFQQVYGKTLDQVEKDLHRYMGARSYKVMSVDAKLERLSEPPEVAPLPEHAATLLMARVLMNSGKLGAAMEELQPLLREQPDHGELNELLGLRAASRGDHEQAIQHFAKAVAGGLRSGPLLELYVELLWDQGQYDEAIKALRGKLEIDRHDVDARLRLASMLLNQGKAGEALRGVAEIQQATRLQAMQAYRLRAYCQWRLGALPLAKQSAGAGAPVRGKTGGNRASRAVDRAAQQQFLRSGESARAPPFSFSARGISPGAPAPGEAPGDNGRPGAAHPAERIQGSCRRLRVAGLPPGGSALPLSHPSRRIGAGRAKPRPHRDSR